MLIGEIRAALSSNASFGWESTLAGRSHAPILRAARERGYEVELHYLSVPSPRICVERVARRVREGGHNVPVADIAKREKLPQSLMPPGLLEALTEREAIERQELEDRLRKEAEARQRAGGAGDGPHRPARA